LKKLYFYKKYSFFIVLIAPKTSLNFGKTRKKQLVLDASKYVRKTQ